MDRSKKIEAVRHTAENDRESVHNAVNKASKDASFISQVVGQLDTLKFPAYKHHILSFIKDKSSDENTIGLLKSLNDTVLFRDKYDVMQGLKQENSESKQQNQVSDNTRKNLEVQHPDKTQRRKDYPETPATAMKNYICNFCGKDFQSKDQLTKHQEFEFKGKGQE
ncbi:MAG TPA: hypothetical protein VNA18_02090 [Nitrososphaeraceae archaeon]|nr:hypothetical protein [Nitrososphaeraceae archaeon]